MTIQGCSYDNVGYGVQLADFSNTFAAAERNDFQNVHWFGVWLRAAFPAVVGYHEGPIPELFPEPSSFLISHNTIHAIDVADGIGILDYASLVGAGKTLEAVVESNTIILDNTWWGGIWGGAAQDVVVAKNQFTGFSYMPGIYMGVFGDSVSGWTILGNNVQNLNAYVAQIWLGSGTSGCTVVGGSTQTNVWDQGTDNILVGVNNMQGNDPGQEIKDAMMQKLAIHR